MVHPRFHIPFTFGTAAGFLSFSWFVILYATGANPLGPFRIFGAWIPVLFCVMALKKLRQESVLTGFGSAFMASMTTILVMAFLRAMLEYFFIEFYDYSVVSRYFNDLIRDTMEMKNSAAFSSLADTQLEALQEAKSSASAATIAFSEINLFLMGGIPLSLILAFIFKK